MTTNRRTREQLEQILTMFQSASPTDIETEHARAAANGTSCRFCDSLDGVREDMLAELLAATNQIPPPKPDPVQVLAGIMDSIATFVEAVTGARKQLIDLGWSEHGAEQILASVVAAGGQAPSA